MEDSLVDSGNDSVEKSPGLELKKQLPSPEGVKRTSKAVKANVTSASKALVGPTGATRKKIEPRSSSTLSSSSTMVRPALTRSTVDGGTSRSVPVTRRNSTGSLPAKLPVTKQTSGVSSVTVAGKKTSTLASEQLRRSLPEARRNFLPTLVSKPSPGASTSETRKSVPISPVARSSLTLPSSDSSKLDSLKKASIRSSPSLSSSRRVPSSSIDSTASSTGSSTFRKVVSKVSSPSVRSPTVSSGSKFGSLSTPRNRSSSLSGRAKAATPESRDTRFFMLPQVEIKAGDDVRLDLRGHRIRSLNASGLNLSPNLEFVYLRDNLLSTLEGIEILKRVKVLDLSFNDFKGPGFEPLETCKALQQLYLAGNQITSLKTLPELPNLEFLSVAQNKLKSLSMASQPRLQDLATWKIIGRGNESDGLYLLDEVVAVHPSNVASVVCQSSLSPFQLHCRYGHPSLPVLKKLCPELKYVSSLPCESCEFAKHQRSSYSPRVMNRVASLFELVHTDVWGPYTVPSKTGMRYFVTFIDDYSRSTWLYLMTSRDELFEIFSSFCAEVKTQFNCLVQNLRSDNAKEYFSSRFSSYMSQNGMIHQSSCVVTPQQNGVAERKNRHLLEVARALMFQMNVPKCFWADALHTAAFLINRRPSSVLEGQIPYSILRPFQSLFPIPPKTFGCTCFVQRCSTKG